MLFFHRTIRHGVERLTSRIGVDGLYRELGDDLPLRSELFSVSQLERHAVALADWHQVDRGGGSDRLLARLADNERVLFNAYHVVAEAVDGKRPISPAGEWLLDNFHLIEEQIRTARRHLPKRYSRGLPRLLVGPSAGYPRVYDIALELISHVDGQTDAESITRFVEAYQRQGELKLGELWAIPIMLRQALIENLRRVGARIAKSTQERDKAGRWADRFVECSETSPSKLILAVGDLARHEPVLLGPFVAEMARRLRGQGPALAVPMSWIEQQLGEAGRTIEQMVQAEGQQQAIDQVSIGNSIISLRELDAIDWRAFVESLSGVEQTLRDDPGGVYAKMDFATRDQYRHVIERIAKRSPLSECEVAGHAVRLARKNSESAEPDERKSHVGYFLVDQGLPALERVTQTRLNVSDRIGRLGRRVALPLYVAAISLIAITVTLGVLWYMAIPLAIAWVVAGLLFVAASHLGVAIVNWLVALSCKPHRLPRLDFSRGIPPEFTSLVAVPTMISSSDGIDQLLEKLEVHYLANRDANLRFCLLTDFCDAAQEHLPEDASLLRTAETGIEALNTKYGTDGGAVFFLLHRPRHWNPSEHAWMGQERKRGKLSDLNKLLRGGSQSRFSSIVGDLSLLTDIKYVLTLDTDTLLPRNVARQLVGALAHPLNHARIDQRRNVVYEGYGILQPGVATKLDPGGQSWFARLNGGDPGIDPYTRTVSDVYQDWFHEGSFIGKGIYNVDAFSATTEQRLPDNRILSHDLIEGCYARCGLVSDIQLFETYPTRYSSDVSRRHRWMRGDWQISGWIAPSVAGPNGESQRNSLSLLSRWKILDNLRRSVVPWALVLLLVMGWLVLMPAVLWTLLVVGIILLPSVCISMAAAFRKDIDVAWRSHLREVLRTLVKNLAQATLTLILLPYEAYVSLDAFVRTMIRMHFTHKHMLEWKTSSDVEREKHHCLVEAYKAMWVAPALAIIVIAAVVFLQPGALWAALPLLILWLLAPAVAWRISWPPHLRDAKLSAAQTLFLHRFARITWRFFDRFVGPEDNWLPPDNFQESPGAIIAHRTSPTNIGVSLLSTLAATDFGYLSAGRLVERTKATFATLDRLERFHGHFLNWYDTRSLQPLDPWYVSSVDSGNLSGHLLTLRIGLLELPSQPIVTPRLWESLAVMRQILGEVSAEAGGKAMNGVIDSANWRRLVDLLPPAESVDSSPRSIASTMDLLRNLQQALQAFSIGPPDHDEPELFTWLRDLENQCDDHLEDLSWMAPWLAHPSCPVRPMGEASVESEKLVDALEGLVGELNTTATMKQIADIERFLPRGHRADDNIQETVGSVPDATERWISELRQLLCTAAQHARQRMVAIERLVLQCGELADVEYDFLYDRSRRLLAIGFNVSQRRRDPSFYDLLASEARLASFVAIAQGHLDQEHWFALGRLLTTSNGRPTLLSWSGSMFEYLMPLLVMPTYENTLLDETYHAVVDRHIEYGSQRGVPWGISESGYNLTDAQLNFQYRAFGVPGLGFKRGLVDDLVVAPYATAMALMVAPERACANLQLMAGYGWLGRYGFYEAADFTRSRVPRGQVSAVVQSYMAHHQGMSFLSLAYLLLGRPMQRRFQMDPQLQATELLLQERIPEFAPIFPHSAEVTGDRTPSDERVTLLRVYKTPDTPVPEVHLLSNGRYHVMVTGAGGGYSSWKGIAVTRWREDTTRDNFGSFCYVRDLESEEVWSTTHQPTLRATKRYEAIFSQARAEFRRSDSEIAIHTEIAVSPEDDIEIRRSTFTNHSHLPRTIELTSYAEVVLAPAAADRTHPAFSNLFVQTEILDSRQAILCTRRPRSDQEKPPWMLHLIAVVGATTGETSYETDRLKFVGRCRSVANPEAMSRRGKLSNSAGSVLDPIVAIRLELTLMPDETVSVDLVTGVAETRESAEELIDKYRDRHLADRLFDMAWTHAQVVLRQLNASEADAQLFGRLAGSVVYANPALRANTSILKRNRLGQSGLWGHGISGDLPIVLVRISDHDNISIVRQLVQAHAFWRLKGLGVDLVIWNEGPEGYRQILQDAIVGLISAGAEAQTLDHPGGVFVRRAEQMSDDDRTLLQTVARAVIVDTEGSLSDQLDQRLPPDLRVPKLVPAAHRFETIASRESPRDDLVFWNGLGGFTADGREYVIRIGRGQVTPAPWVNVIANSGFGTVISESGGAYCWSENAHEFRLTPWYNDPVSDQSGEALYLRDEESGEYWSPTPLPVSGQSPYVCRHGFGYSVFEHCENGISSELWVYVAIDAPIKFSVLKIRNRSGRSRRLSATAYCEWVLGESRTGGSMHVVTEVDPGCGALLARNPFSIEFSDRIAFLDVNDPSRSLTGDRTEFLGRHGAVGRPAAMGRTRLSGKVGAGLDPCAAMQTSFELPDGRDREVVFTMGAAHDTDEVRRLVQRFRGVEPARNALDAVWNSWNRTLGAIHVETPDPSVNIMANGWLLYQTLACRYWARTGYYQSGGAFGFRDQLQDVAALVHAEPQLVREHLLRSAGRQFSEGDVQHWWHPPQGRGVRTHFSDDFLWLPLVTCRYVTATGDVGILDELVPFLSGRELQAGEEAYYDLPEKSTETESLYEHCVRAITNGLSFGRNGLPLIGCGDWNDGMNLVGQDGQGESVWLAFFLYENLQRFSALAESRGDHEFAERCHREAERLRENIEQNAWDGDWYRRAYFDNGEPLGSATRSECQIDSIAQSWSVLSGAGSPERIRRAMEAVDQRLVRRNSSLIQLFDPPFDKSHQNPGYIKGYVPGVRENGGQYTHAAIWTVMAFAELGDHHRAWELFSMIHPIHHGSTPSQIATYKVEPYVVAADVYAVAPHIGRGGWTWYTGSASWMYRLMIESLLGLQLEVDRLRFAPCLPADWKSFKLHYRYRETVYHITVLQPAPGWTTQKVLIDGIEQPDDSIRMNDDRQDHQVEVTLLGNSVP